MSENPWFAANLAAINRRLEGVRSAPDGILYHKPESDNDIMVCKQDGVVYLYFHPDVNEEIQSRLQLSAPVHLLSPYSRMAMLALLWRPEPVRVYIIGFGGGRLPMVMHHFLPATQVDCAEIDADVVDVARRYFGTATDARLHIALQDGRRVLAEHKKSEPYDIIVVDAFVGLGAGPRAFSTMEFFALCREKLSPDGVVVINSLDKDQSCSQKRLTILESFPLVMHIRDHDMGNEVLFGCNSAHMTKPMLLERARALDGQLGLSFSLADMAEAMEVMPLPPAVQQRAPVLRDVQAPVAAPVKVGRNDPCPCGSTLKYKKCCG